MGRARLVDAGRLTPAVAELLDDKVAIVSGVGPGLGRELALAFAREGAHVVLAARTASRLEEVADEIAERWPGRRTLSVATDISDPAQTDALVARTMATWGRIDCLVNSAFVPAPFTRVEEASFAEWRRAYDVTVFGTLQLTQGVIPHMRAAGRGSIVFVNSMIQKKPLLDHAGYASSKGALLAAARVLAKELGPDGIRVNSAVMGWMWGAPVESYVDAAVAAGRVRDEVIGEITRDIPLGSIPEDADCANAVVFLASDLARAVTGAALDVNGGEMMV